MAASYLYYYQDCTTVKIIVCHNYYREPGGEDQCVPMEIALLRKHGHEVIEFAVRSSDLDDSVHARLTLGRRLLLSPTVIRRTIDLVRKEQPDVVHVHNVFPLLTPSLYIGLARAGVPVVQTVHNYRFICPNGLFYSEGHVCRLCAGKNFSHAIRHRCLHGSLAQTVAYAASLQLHWLLGTFPGKLGLLAALSPFVAEQLAQRIGSRERIRVLPNFIDTTPFTPQSEGREYVLFMGRLSAEKGVWQLLRAVQDLPDIPVKIMGGGPEEDGLREAIEMRGLEHVELLGYLGGDARFDVLKRAICLVVPSQSHETFGRVVLEAYAMGVPVIASRMGGLQDLVHHGETGFLFEAGDTAGLAACIREMVDAPGRAVQMGLAGRRLAEACYSPEAYYQQLMALYREVCQPEVYVWAPGLSR